MDIPGFVYIIVGLVVVGVSYSIGEALQVFLYAGFVFIGFGIVKWYLLRGKKVEMPARTHAAYCRQCGIVLPAGGRYCGMCGYRVS